MTIRPPFRYKLTSLLKPTSEQITRRDWLRTSSSFMSFAMPSLYIGNLGDQQAEDAKPRWVTRYRQRLVLLAPPGLLGPVRGEPVDPVPEGEDVGGDEDDDDEGHDVEEPGAERRREDSGARHGDAPGEDAWVAEAEDGVGHHRVARAHPARSSARFAH